MVKRRRSRGRKNRNRRAESNPPSPALRESKHMAARPSGDGPNTVPRVSDGVGHQVEIAHHVEVSSGPLPPPSMLQAYEDIVPGAAERILSMAENQLAHRHHQESVRLSADVKLESRGQWMALGMVVTALALGGGLIAVGESAAGVATILGAAAGIGGVFVASKWKNRTSSPSSARGEPDLPSDLPAVPE